MKAAQKITSIITVTFLTFVAPSLVWAHCDTLDGPVVSDARIALSRGDITPVLKWVRPSDEPEVRSAFNGALAVRTLSPEAQELAETYFFETVVRIHRAGEGAPYAGLKPAGRVEPAIALADQALETGSVERLSSAVTAHVKDGVHERFQRAASAKEHVADSVAAGRDFVAAYVEFTHYVEGLHQAATGAGPHHEHTEHD